MKLIAPRYVKPFIKRQKNCAADAEAIVEAALRPGRALVEPNAGGVWAMMTRGENYRGPATASAA